MTNVWVGTTGEAAEGDYVVTPAGDLVEVARIENGEACRIGEVPASAIDLDDRERLLTAVRGVETAANTRGG